jgi:hypothetical protein
MKRHAQTTCHPMNQDSESLPRLADLEREVLAQAREWGRQRLQERLQELADQSSEVFPPLPAQTPGVDAAKRVGGNKTER